MFRQVIIINTMSIFLLITITIIFILVYIFFTKKHKRHEVIKGSYVLGTLVSLRVYGSGSKAEKAIDEAIKKLNNIDDKMSAFKENSEISKINFKAGISYEAVSDETYFVVKKAIKYSSILEGTFDPTIRPLVKLWSIGTKEEKVPEETEIIKKKKLVNYKDIILEENSKSIMLKQKEQALDVGGIAKGFAADEVRKIFLKHNIKSALIDLGGNILAIGSKENNIPWRVGVQNPFEPRGEFLGILSIRNKSVVTSGNYERYFRKVGKRFHHIIDPQTGYPSESKIISATIISDNSIDGDGLSTGIYILGVNKALNIIEAIKGIEAILVTEDKKVYMTSKIGSIFELTNDEFITGEKL